MTTTTLDKIGKKNGDNFTQDDISKIDNNTQKIQTVINGLSTVASTGSYNDLIDKPTIPTSGGTGGSIVTASSTNGNIKINGTETVVYTAPTYTKSDVGLGNVDNTSDLNKPISIATQNALNTKATVVALTASEYSALSSPNPTTLYLIIV
jgi:hypothetical protein